MMGVRYVIYLDLRRRSDVAQSRVSRHWLKVNSVTSTSGPVLPHSLLGNFNHILGTSDRLQSSPSIHRPIAVFSWHQRPTIVVRHIDTLLTAMSSG